MSKRKQDIIICRCEDITLEDIHNLFDQGYTDIEELKRILRVGMGPCQGSTCNGLIQRELANYLGVRVEEVKTQKVRPLITGVKLKAIKDGSINES